MSAPGPVRKTAALLEISGHIIGAPAGVPAAYRPWITHVPFHGLTSVQLYGTTNAGYGLYVELSDWTELSGGWLACRIGLRDYLGASLGRRPAMVYDRPHDVPTHTSFHIPETGTLYSLGLRSCA